jgi:hypothetical protein
MIALDTLLGGRRREAYNAHTTFMTETDHRAIQDCLAMTPGRSRPVRSCVAEARQTLGLGDKRHGQ